MKTKTKSKQLPLRNYAKRYQMRISESINKEKKYLTLQKKNFNVILSFQARVVVALLFAIFISKQYFPHQYLLLKQTHETLFETIDYTPSLVRFSQQATAILTMQVQAEASPEEAVFAQYQTNELIVLPVEQFYISSGYGWRDNPFTGEQAFHGGIDFASEQGEVVFAAMDGMIASNYKSVSYGNCITIQHADGSVTRYAHLQYAFARVGEIVSAGTQIGTVGQTGYATGAHLHFETIVNGERQNPSAALGLE